MLSGAPCDATETGAEEPVRILVTFANERATALMPGGPPGRQYRHRSRYAVSARARRDARAIAREYALQAGEDWPIKSLGVYCVVYRLGEDADADALLGELAADERVESAQLLQRFHTLAGGATGYNDPYARLQHALTAMRVREAHRYARGDGVRVALIDTGVDERHEDLAGRIAATRDFVERPGGGSRHHGTAVAAVIAAADNNGAGMVGVAPAARLTVLRACWGEDDPDAAVCNSFTLAKALDAVVSSRPDIVNMSLVGPSDRLLERVLERVLAAGIVVVAAAPPATEGAPARFPADASGVLKVASVPPAPGGAGGAKHAPGEAPLHAPGERVLTALPGNAYDFRSGSSLAAAHVTGIAALLLERVPTLSVERLRAALDRSQWGSRSGSQPGAGARMVDACLALTELRRGPRCVAGERLARGGEPR